MKKLFSIILIASCSILTVKAQTQAISVNPASIIVNTNQLLFFTNIISSAQGFLFSQISANGGHPTTVASFGGLTWHNGSQKALQSFVAGVTNSLDGTLFTPTAFKTVTNTLTETSIIPTSGVGAIGLAKSFPANFWTAGKEVTILMRGNYDTSQSVGAPTMILRGKFGGNTIASSTEVLSAGNPASWLKCEMVITCYTVGVSGTFTVNTHITSTQWAIAATSFTSVVADTTGATTFDITVELGETTTSIRIQNVKISVAN